MYELYVTQYLSEPAIVLNVTPLREADLSITLLTKNLGKISAFARNARSSKKRFMGGIDLYEYAIFELLLRNQEDPTYSVESLSQRIVWEGIRSRLDKLCLTALVVEVTHVFLAEGDREGNKMLKPLFNFLKNLDQLTTPHTCIISAIYFCLILFQHSGYDPIEENSNNIKKFKKWWLDLIVAKAPILPPDPEYILEGLYVLISYAEKILARSLRTKKELLICLS